MRPLFLYISMSSFLLLWRCAQVAPLTGGARDTTAPRLQEAIPAENSVRLNVTEISLRFDEYVQLKDLSNQLVITPLVDPAPDISAEGKKVLIRFDSKALRPNTTYRIHFGEAIADMNESNPVRDFKYVFSTGPVIDSLRLSGSITDAFSGVPVKGVVAALYPAQSADSVIFRKKPDYLARSSESGTFLFENLPATPFRLYAFADQNRNGLYDGASERVAFHAEPLQLTSDTSLKLRLFQEEVVKGFIKNVSSPHYGNGQLILNKKAQVRLRPLKTADTLNMAELNRGKEKDTVIFFYRKMRDTLKLAVDLPGSGRTDTVRLALPKPSSRSRLRPVTVSTASGKLVPGEKIQFRFSDWMDTIRTNTSKIRISSKEDTLVDTRNFSGRWKAVNRFELSGELREGMTYSLKLDTAAFFDVHGQPNDSSLSFFKFQSRQEFGKLTLKLRFDRKLPFVVQLLDPQGQVVKQGTVTVPIAATMSKDIEFTEIPPASYTVKVIYDSNGNARWDSGDVMKRIQPEEVFIHGKTLNVLADWEMEEEISVKR